ncbi:hypothetical protein [Psychrobacter sp. NG27]|uniref:hypothetical protein n=1 Tax=Psychrobacter sp. NG27 TaxID=2781966 RepID=UPI0018DFBD1F|nr:hypothetical protein [Psychrobacter sp. NG27]MBI0427161.1 hypothetical protein [Psychrobacter sp. NG27]
MQKLFSTGALKLLGWAVVIVLPLAVVFYYYQTYVVGYVNNDSKVTRYYKRAQRYIKRIEKDPELEQVEKQLLFAFLEEKLEDRLLDKDEYEQVLSQYEAVHSNDGISELQELLNKSDNTEDSSR